MFMLSVQEEAIDFTGDDFFDQLDSMKKAQYIDTLRKVHNNIVKLHAQYRFFLILYHIAQSEQMIALLGENLMLQRNKLLSKQLDESIGRRGLAKLKKNIQTTRTRLKHEIHTLLQQIEILVKRTHFSDMQPERQNEFYEMWKTHTASLIGIDNN